MGMKPVSIISPLLTKIRQRPALPPNTWYFITATALSALNRPDQIPAVYEHALELAAPEEHLHMTRRMREALVKSIPVCGLPKAINALLSLKSATPPLLLDLPDTTPSPTGRREALAHPTATVLECGQACFDSVYGKVSQRVMGQMERSGTEDLGLAARLMYGYLFSNTKILGPAETSFVLLAGLIPQEVNPQLKGHLKGALNGGATVEQVRAVRGVVMDICEASGMQWRGDVVDL